VQILVRRTPTDYRLSRTTSRKMPKFRRFRRVRIILQWPYSASCSLVMVMHQPFSLNMQNHTDLRCYDFAKVLLVTTLSFGKGFTTCFRYVVCTLTANHNVFSHTFVMGVMVYAVFNNAFYTANGSV